MAEIPFVPVSASGGTVKFGTYTGNGAESQTINLGVTPKWVLVFLYGSQTMYGSQSVSGGLALQGYPATCSNSTSPAITIVSNGFKVYLNSFSITNKDGYGIYFTYLYGT